MLGLRWENHTVVPETRNLVLWNALKLLYVFMNKVILTFSSSNRFIMSQSSVLII